MYIHVIAAAVRGPWSMATLAAVDTPWAPALQSDDSVVHSGGVVRGAVIFNQSVVV